MDDFDKILDAICDIDVLCHFDTIDDLVLALIEEVGEAGLAIRVERGRKKRKLNEPAYSECVDILINALALYFKTGGTMENLGPNMLAKLKKWRSRYDEHGNLL